MPGLLPPRRTIATWGRLFANWFHSLAFIARLCLTLALVYAFGAAVAVIGIASLMSAQRTTEQLVDNDLAGALIARQAQVAIAETASAELMLTAATSSEERTAARDALVAGLKSLDTMLSDPRFAPTALATRARGEHRKARELAQSYIELMMRQPLDALMFDPTVSVDGHFVIEQLQRLADVVKQLGKDQMQQADATRVAASASQRHAQRIMAGLLIASLIASAAMAWLLARQVREELGGEPADASRIAGGIASGDLTQAILLRRDDSGSMLAKLSTMQAELRTILSGIKQTTGSVSTATREISAGNLDLSARTERQAALIEQATSSMQALLAEVRHAQAEAGESSSVATRTLDAVMTGSAITERMAGKMHDLHGHSRAIAEIVQLIESVAFQTNILALNASVEAARAGTQGRGFAVVAAEVRTLAQRCAGAAREIGAVISRTVADVEAGAALAHDATQAMTQVRTSVERSVAFSAAIETSSRGQVEKIDRLGAAMRTMDESTQQNAALVQQVAAAASLLHRQAEGLAASAATFRL